MGSLNISSPPAQPSDEVEQSLLPSAIPDSAPPKFWRPTSRSTFLSITLVLLFTTVACIVLATAYLSCTLNRRPNPNPNPNAAQSWGLSRPLKILKKPVVLLISSDGFRYGYHWKLPLPNIDRLRSNGTEAVPGMVPVYPTLTFPNYYSIATGLYPAWHGIVANHFTDPSFNESFHPGVIDPKWWLGEPIWETVVKNGLISATYFWPGSDVSKGEWKCTQPYCQYYNGSIPYDDRVNTVLGFFDLPEDRKPSLITLYFEEPDHTGHAVGADDPRINQAIQLIDKTLGKLLDGLEARQVLDDVSIILLSDHGMVATCDKKIIYLEDLKPWIDIPVEWMDSMSPVLAIRPSSDAHVNDVYQKITEALNSGQVANSEFLKVYLKEDFPSRLHYAHSERIQPILGIVAEGFKVEMKRSKSKECAGSHGYDNQALSMHPIFIAHGPQFANGRQIPSFSNIEVYNLIASILNIQGSQNNGTSSFANDILLPSQ